MYKNFIRPILFLIDPERVHHITFSLLKFFLNIPGAKSISASLYKVQHPKLRTRLFGIDFENPVGLAAGFDKDARLIDELENFGFGFIEIGTLTPKAQPGNDKPRLFRLQADNAIINRMGFNNQGVEMAAQRLQQRKGKCIIGGNIGKNKVTLNENAGADYEACFHALYPYVDYFVVNVSSPNTPGLRSLQEKEPLKNLLAAVIGLSRKKEKYKPILLKIAPDLTTDQLADVVEVLKETNTDGIIATNTTISREGLLTPAAQIDKMGAGGLSGKPLATKSTEIIHKLRGMLGAHYPIIAVGGIMTAEDALEKFKAGANLVQIYTGFIYEGPGLVRAICKRIIR